MGDTDKHKKNDDTPRTNPGSVGGQADTPWVPGHVHEGAHEGSQTNQPFEQDPKRRLGQHEGTGEAPLKKP